MSKTNLSPHPGDSYTNFCLWITHPILKYPIALKLNYICLKVSTKLAKKLPVKKGDQEATVMGYSMENASNRSGRLSIGPLLKLIKNFS